MIRFLQACDDLDYGTRWFLVTMASLWSVFLFLVIPGLYVHTVDSLAGQPQPTYTEVSK